MKKLWSVILCAVLLIGLLPFSAFADNAISAIGITGFELPTAGMTAGELTGTTSVPSGADYQIVLEYWYCDTDVRTMSDGDVFELGKEYSHFWRMEAGEGYVFDNLAAVTINGGTEYVDSRYCGIDGSNSYYGVWSLPAEATIGEGVFVSGFNYPLVGQTAGENLATLSVPAGADYEIADAWWNCVTDHRDMTPENAFEAGKTYFLSIIIVPLGERRFDDDSIPLTLNGGTDLIDRPFTEFAGSELSFFTIDMTPLTVITEVNVTGFQTPVIGQSAAENVANIAAPSGVGYKLSDIEWYSYTLHDFMKGSDKFEAGSYMLTVVAYAADGYAFTEDALPSTSINGSDSLVDRISTFEDDNGKLAVTIYTAIYDLGELINAISLDGFIRPTVGMTGEEAAIYTVLPEGAEYTATKTYWYCDTDSRTMEPEDVFEAGKVYSHNWTVSANEGFIFASDAEVLINGGAALVDYNYTDRESNLTGFDVWTLPMEPAAEDMIEAVDITLILPRPDVTILDWMSAGSLSLAIENHYSSAVKFFDHDGSPVNPNSKFEAGTSYYIEFYISPNDGYAFDEDFLAVLINGSTELLDLENTYFYDNEGKRCLFTRTKEFSPENPVKRITEVGVTGYEAPQIGQTMAENIASVSVSAGAHYYIENIFWRNVTDSENMFDDDVFEAGKTYYLHISLRPESGYTFGEDTPAAYLNGGTELIDPGSVELWVPDMVFSTFNVTLNAASAKITEIRIDGFTAPQAGQKGYYNLTSVTIPEDAPYHLHADFWVTSAYQYYNFEPFESGKQYSAHFEFVPNEGYEFGDSITVYINGGTELVDTDSFIIGNIDTGEPCFSINTVLIAPEAGVEIISSVVINGFTMPEVGQTAGENRASVTLPDDAPYEIRYDKLLSWYEAETGNWLDDADVFEAGKTYGFKINLAAKDGYIFNIATNITVTLTGGDGLLDRTSFEVWERDKTFGFGSVDITPEEEAIMYGDVNGDGEITGKDLIRLRKYLNGEDVEIFAGADVNGDGAITGKDLIRLRKYLSGEGVVLGPG